MTWATFFFILYLIELGIWAYIFYLHFEEKIDKKPKPKFSKEHKVIIKSKKDIVRG